MIKQQIPIDGTTVLSFDYEDVIMNEGSLFYKDCVDINIYTGSKNIYLYGDSVFDLGGRVLVYYSKDAIAEFEKL